MGVLSGVLTVVFFVLCVLLILIILLQSDKSAGMGILGGSSQTTFGSSTADVITKITTVFVTLFMLGSLGISVLESYRTRAFDPGTGGPAQVETQQVPQGQAPGGVRQDGAPAGKQGANQVKKNVPGAAVDAVKKEMNSMKK
ncbi:MAG: preprotein translocase subunit SecG [Spirochaetes bacterium]|nr:preprotein translocase subunit SecG [Spirochaetota bacterium]